jgi:hypothetical protein
MATIGDNVADYEEYDVEEEDKFDQNAAGKK